MGRGPFGGNMDIALKTAQLLVSRICHDLAGGVSAIGAGVELLSEDGSAVETESLDLIASSAHQTSQRLQFMRAAFGQSGGNGESFRLSEIIALTHGFLEGGRVSLIAASEERLMPLGPGKLLLNLALLGAEALPKGGVLSLSALDVDGRLGFAVSAEGAGARFSPDTRAAFRPDIDPESLTARTVNAHFTAVLAQNLGAELEIGEDEGGHVRLAALVGEK